MADGTKRPIEEVRAGDRVRAMDPKDGQVVDREVVRTFRNVTDTVVDVTWAPLDRVECMAIGQRGRGERHSVGVARSGGESSEDGEPPSADEAQTVRCTPGHPWWVESQQRWVLAGDLRVGAQLRLEDGRLAVVQAVASRHEVARTFNFEVEGLHTYCVAGPDGRAAAVVHNSSLAALAKAAKRMKGATTVARVSAIARTPGNVLIMNRWRGLVEEGIIAARAGQSSAYELVGTQIAVGTGRKLASGRPEIRIIDTLVRHRATGALLSLESKTGSAVRSLEQIAKDDLLAQGLGTFTGRRAADAGLIGAAPRILTWTISRP